jgi:hypothetical protein
MSAGHRSGWRPSKLVSGAVTRQFDDWSHGQVERFIAYLREHRHCIVNYAYYQAEGISIGSGENKSTVKQIGRRIKIFGAKGDEDNVQQVPQQRCAYLNDYFSR